MIIKPEREQAAREVFRDTAINVTTEALGSRSFLEEYVGEKVDEWVNEVTNLADFAISQPQASSAAFTFGMRHRWTYFLRTVPDIANKAPDAPLDIHARGFWKRQRSAFFDVWVCHPNADSYRDLTPKQIYKKHKNEKKRQYAESHGDRTGNVHSPSFHDHRWNGG